MTVNKSDKRRGTPPKQRPTINYRPVSKSRSSSVCRLRGIGSSRGCLLEEYWGSAEQVGTATLTTYVQMADNADLNIRRMAMPALAKDTRLHIRCDQEIRRLLDKAAAYAHMSVSEFVLRNAVEQAQSVVQAHEAITLSQDDFAAFLNALDTPAAANPALERAFARHAKHVQ